MLITDDQHCVLRDVSEQCLMLADVGARVDPQSQVVGRTQLEDLATVGVQMLGIGGTTVHICLGEKKCVIPSAVLNTERYSLCYALLVVLFVVAFILVREDCGLAQLRKVLLAPTTHVHSQAIHA